MHEFQNKKSSTSSNYFYKAFIFPSNQKCIYDESLCVNYGRISETVSSYVTLLEGMSNLTLLFSPSFVCSLPTFLITQFKEKERNLSSKVHLWCSTKENKNCWLVESIFSLKHTKPHLYTYAQNQIHKNKNGNTF